MQSRTRRGGGAREREIYERAVKTKEEAHRVSRLRLLSSETGCDFGS